MDYTPGWDSYIERVVVVVKRFEKKPNQDPVLSGTATAPAMDFMKVNTLKRYQSTPSFYPLSCMTSTLSFYMGVPQGVFGFVGGQ